MDTGNKQSGVHIDLIDPNQGVTWAGKVLHLVTRQVDMQQQY